MTPGTCQARSVTAGQPPRDSGIFHVRAKTALTGPVLHRIRQLSGSGEGQDRTRHDHGGGRRFGDGNEAPTIDLRHT